MVSIENLMRDPAAIAIHPIYYGAFSNIGILFWSATVAVCLFNSYLLSKLSAKSEYVWFFLLFGGFSIILCLDDLFMLHEWLFPEKLYISEDVVFASYAVAFTAIVLRFRWCLLATKPILFLVSCLLFSTSVIVDLLPLEAVLTENDIYWLEDGSKFLAIFFWLTYFVGAAIEVTLRSIHTRDTLLSNKFDL